MAFLLAAARICDGWRRDQFHVSGACCRPALSQRRRTGEQMRPEQFLPDIDRYDGRMPYRRCGRSGLDLPAVSLGLWQNFGGADVFETGRAILRRGFDLGVTHFDLANNYGPPYG